MNKQRELVGVTSGCWACRVVAFFFFLIEFSTLTLEVLDTDICINKNGLYNGYSLCIQCKEILVLEYD